MLVQRSERRHLLTHAQLLPVQIDDVHLRHLEAGCIDALSVVCLDRDDKVGRECVVSSAVVNRMHKYRKSQLLAYSNALRLASTFEAWSSSSASSALALSTTAGGALSTKPLDFNLPANFSISLASFADCFSSLCFSFSISTSPAMGR
mmetsp:Transcript_30513/g.47776  ORF Transcript_30513/g.47776 Transcript_30513/m.47776 type:complete len:148 (+) Transcript_30513:2066-2509(+)